MTAAAPIIEGRDLTVTRGGKRLVHVSQFGVEPGRVHVLLGPNGAGKTTLLRALNGLERAEGDLFFEGRPVKSGGDRLHLRRHTAAVFQQAYLLATTVRGNVESGLKLRGFKGDELHRKATAAMELLGIEHLADRRRPGLSGGEAQRVSIARALAVDPKVVFLDEPMASLDPPTRRGLLADLERIFRSLSTAVVWVTHDTEEALAVADLTTFLAAGEIIQHGLTTQVFNNPATQAIADYLGLDVWFEGVVEPAEGGISRLVLPGGARLHCLETPSGPAVASVHPEDVLLFLEAPVAGTTTLRNVVEATVREIQTSGRSSRVVLDWAGGRLDASVTRAACEDLGIHAGQTVHAAVKATAIQVLPRSAQQ